MTCGQRLVVGAVVLPVTCRLNHRHLGQHEGCDANLTPVYWSNMTVTLTMEVEEISQRPNDTAIHLRTKNPLPMRDSIATIATNMTVVEALALTIGSKLRVVMEVVDGQ